MKNVLVMTVGLPRSGKSTWAHEQATQGTPVVNPDSIRMSLHGKEYREDANPVVWAIARVMVESLFLSGHTRVILDATNTVKKYRRQWKDSRWIREYRIFDTPKEECIRRAKVGGRNYLCPVIGRMAANWEPIDKDDRDDPREVPDPS